MVDLCAAELFAIIFHSFEAVIANWIIRLTEHLPQDTVDLVIFARF